MEAVFRRCSIKKVLFNLKFHKSHRKISVPKSLYVGLQFATFFKGEITRQVFSYEFRELLKNTSFIKQLRETASDYKQASMLTF